MKLAFGALFFSLLFLIPSAWAERCTPASDSCDFYECIEKRSDKKFSCGKYGYALNFGARNCPKYLEVEGDLSPDLQEMLPQVRLCLQEEFAAIVHQTKKGKNYCTEVEEAAFHSHLPCYLNFGFCELSRLDQLKILRLTGLTFFHPLSLKASLEINAGCLVKEATP